jgi:predicted transcriptional regulator
MSTTTIRLPDDLRSQVKLAAERAGTTAHSFILEAISEKANKEDRHDDFNHSADTRYAKIVATGKTIAWSDMKRYLQSRVDGKRTARPVARKLAR